MQQQPMYAEYCDDQSNFGRSQSRANTSFMETNSLIDELNDSRQSIPSATATETKDDDVSMNRARIRLIEPVQAVPPNLLISREGKRKQMNKSRTAAMINRTIHRKKKTQE